MTNKQPVRLSPEAVYEQRTELVKDILAKESAARDAKTAKLRALRLARDAELAAKPQTQAPKPKRKR